MRSLGLLVCLGVVWLASPLQAQTDTKKFLKSLQKEVRLYERLQNKQKQHKAKDGGFFGMGFGMIDIKKDSKQGKSQTFPIVLSFKGGYQSYFSSFIGLKVFAALDLATSVVNWDFNKPPSNSFYGVASAGLEIPIEFSLTPSYQHFLGFYAGVGGGAVIYMDNDQFQMRNKQEIKTFGVIIQAGAALTLFSKHRIEVGFKILPTNKTLLASQRFETSQMFNVVYLYRF
ncbi:Predicted membrane protein [Helicobacter sp. NHP21005]|uniref:outer membrane beta-barrel protein n=1 Tax=Helicobacter felistomachi TaxID=3040201 RepID=UPI0025738CE4|nr:outer membrane beta-barrel protein [Helicobacter sp. NHP21005]BEG56705.1 Predicted membrane protein [Helicobacter sp. NHP21005]